MRILALLLFAARLGATPIYVQDFSTLPNGQVLTFTAGANYSTTYAASGSAVTASHFGEQSAAITGTGNWMHALYNGLTLTSNSVSITVRCDGSAARCKFAWNISGISGGLPTATGYQLQCIPSINQFKLFRGGYGVEIADAGAIAPSSSSDFTIGVYVSSTGTATMFMDGIARKAVNDTTYTSGYFALGTFGGTAYVTDIYIDDTTPTPAATAVPTFNNPWLRNRLRLILGSRGGGSDKLYASGGSKVGEIYDYRTHKVK